jgi:2-polyprenyl-3-methyl-5-hydroxy-6-metoxy-1,4-benzoquinol methylase
MRTGGGIGDFSAIAHESRYQFFVKKFHLAGKTVLDFGCGSGYGSCLISDSALSVTGIDISKLSIEYAAKTYKKSNLLFLQEDLSDLNFPKRLIQRFDFVVSFDVIEHVERYFDFVENIDSMLAPGGVVVLGCPNRWPTLEINSEWNSFHMQEFTPAQLNWLLRKHFTKVELYSQDFLTKEARRDHITNRQLSKQTTHIGLIKDSVKHFLPEAILSLLRIARRSTIASKIAPCPELVIAPLDLNDKEACYLPFGLIAICRR